MSLAHNGHSQLSDSNTGERDGVWRWNGLSPLGRQVIAEMNRLGMMIDVSHPSKASMMQTIALSKAPIIASHSGVRAICNHSRNMDDEQIRAHREERRRDPARRVQQLREVRSRRGTPSATGSAPTRWLRCARSSASPRPAQADVRAQIDALPAERKNAYLAKQEEIISRRTLGDTPATVRDFVDHIDYVVKLIGIDHVGISSDFDGGGGVDGWRNATRDVQRHARAGAPRLHRRADRQDLGRQPAARDGGRSERVAATSAQAHAAVGVRAVQTPLADSHVIARCVHRSAVSCASALDTAPPQFTALQRELLGLGHKLHQCRR